MPVAAYVLNLVCGTSGINPCNSIFPVIAKTLLKGSSHLSINNYSLFLPPVNKILNWVFNGFSLVPPINEPSLTQINLDFKVYISNF